MSDDLNLDDQPLIEPRSGKRCRWCYAVWGFIVACFTRPLWLFPLTQFFFIPCNRDASRKDPPYNRWARKHPLAARRIRIITRVLYFLIFVFALTVIILMLLPNRLHVSVTSMSVSGGAVLSSRMRGAAALAAVSSAGINTSAAVRSLTAAAYARVDELNLRLAYVRLSPKTGTNMVSTPWNTMMPLTLSAGSSTIPVTATIDRHTSGNGPADLFNPLIADFKATDTVFYNIWTLKAFCRTHTKFVYTTVTGPKAIDPATLPAGGAAPDDYAAFEYNHMGPDWDNVTYLGENQAHMTFINTVKSIHVTNGDTVSLMVDMTNVISCYDGTVANMSTWTSTFGANSTLIPPLGNDVSWGPEGPDQIVDHWNWTVPAFGFTSWVLPVFTYVGGGADQLSGDTYALALSPSLLPNVTSGALIDWARLVIVTASWSTEDPATSSLLDVRMRNSGASDDASTTGFVNWAGTFNITGTPGGAWSFYHGQQRYYSYFMLAERIISGLVRPARTDFSTVGTLTLSNGPDAGKHTGDENHTDPNVDAGGNMHPPLVAPITYYYVQIPRALA